MRVAVAQVEVHALDVEKNIRITTAAIARAAAQGADLVVLPECVASGWVMDPEGIAAVAEPGDGSGPALSAWRTAARRHDIAVVGGYAERAGDVLYNAVAVIARDGELRDKYRKLHLFGAERAVFAAGDLGLPIFDLDGVRLGVLVCYDLRFPEAMRLLALGGADLVAVPTAWVTGFDMQRPSDDDGRIGQVDGARVQANLNQVYVACADLAGELRGVRFLGRSVIISPYGEALIGPLSAAASDVVAADISPAEVRSAVERGEGISPRLDRRTDVYTLGSADAAPAAVNGVELLAELERKRGYVLDLHRTLATRDPAFLSHYEGFLGAAFLQERSLDRRVKELVYIGVLTALSTPRDHLVAHMHAAVAHGATEQEILETVELVLPPTGVPRFIEAMAAFEAAFPEL